MAVEYFEDAFDSITAKLREVIIAKQKDYGHKNITDYGTLGVIVRINDKVNRLKNLLKNNKLPQNETITDTWLDIANYAIIALMLEAKIFELPLKEAE